MRNTLATLLLVAATNAHAAQQLCWELGRAEMAEFVVPSDVGNYCPVTGAYSYVNDKGQKICVTYTQLVTRADERHNGTCGTDTLRVTYECFKYDACMATTKGIGGTCETERLPAFASQTNPPALDCNLMTGVWEDFWFVPWTITQGPEFMGTAGVAITGSVDTDKDPEAALRCGKWPVTGRIYGNGWTTLHITNPRYPGPTPNCLAAFDYAGTTLPTGTYGTYTDSTGYSDAYAMSRVGDPPGVTGTRTTVPQRAPTSAPRPWAPTTAMVPPPPAPILTPFNGVENGKWSGGTWIYLEWAPEQADSFDVYRSQNGGPYAPVLGGLTTLSYKNTGLTPGQKYCYRLYAHNATGVSGASNEVCRVTLPHPQAFGIVMVTGTSGHLTLTWSASSGAQFYRVYYRASSAAPFSLAVDHLPATTLSYTLGGLTDYKAYEVLIQAYNTNGDWANSPSPKYVTPPCGRRVCH